MAKKWTGFAAAALTASLSLGGLGTTYGATLTLAGFGSDVEVEEKSTQTKTKEAEETAKAAAAKESNEAKAAETAAAGQAEADSKDKATDANANGQAAADAANKTADASADGQTAADSTDKAADASADGQAAADSTDKAADASADGQAADASSEQAPAAAEETPASETPSTEEAKEEIDRSMVDTTGFAKAEEYVNVRASGDTEGEVVGTLSLNDSVYIEDVDENGWYKIRSGNVEGYVAGYLIATGEEAQAVADSTAYTYAQVGAETLNVRSDASQDAEVVDMVGQNSNLEVVEDLGDWVKVVTDDGIYGYVSTDYVNTQTVYPTGETIQEQSEREEQEYLAEVARQEAEYAAYLAEQEAAAAAAGTTDAAYADNSYTDTGYTDTGYTDMGYTDAGYTDTTYTDASYTDTTYTDTSYTDPAYTETTAASGSDVDSLYQAYLTAQEAAMTPTDEADAITKANAAIDAYNAYIAACGSTETVASVDATTYTDTSSTGYDTTDYTATETVQEEAPQEETSYSSSGSGVGQQIANYATQFVGNPYVYGGASLTGGADCSGFTMAVFANFGIGLPHNAAAQSGCGTPVSLSDLQPGDLLFYDNGGGIGHVAIYIGGGSVVHASNPETGIKISAYNYRNPVAAVRCA